MTLFSRAWIAYRLRRRFYAWDRERLAQHQRERRAWLLDYVRHNSPFYAERLEPDNMLAYVPVIDKAAMMTHFDRINTARLHRDDLIRFKIAQERRGGLDLYGEGYSVGLSSGTSANRGLTVLSKAERERYGCLLWARSGLPRGIGRVRLLFTLRTNNAAFMPPRSWWAQIWFADYTHSPDALVALMNENCINLLAGPPSLLRMIAARAYALAQPLGFDNEGHDERRLSGRFPRRSAVRLRR